MTLPLLFCSAGERVVIDSIVGGRGMRGRLDSMGIYPGEEVDVLANHGGPVIIRVKGSRFGIGRGMAQRIMVHLNGRQDKK